MSTIEASFTASTPCLVHGTYVVHGMCSHRGALQHVNVDEDQNHPQVQRHAEQIHDSRSTLLRSSNHIVISQDRAIGAILSEYKAMGIILSDISIIGPQQHHQAVANSIGDVLIARIAI